jgi:hypothetical protein
VCPFHAKRRATINPDAVLELILSEWFSLSTELRISIFSLIRLIERQREGQT